MSKKNKKNKNKKSFNPIYEMLLKEEAAEKEDAVAAEKKQVKAGKDSAPAVAEEIQRVKAGAESVCTSRKEAAEKVDTPVAEKKKEVEKEAKCDLTETEAAKDFKEFCTRVHGYKF